VMDEWKYVSRTISHSFRRARLRDMLHRRLPGSCQQTND
jgi:hypothetical protein